MQILKQINPKQIFSKFIKPNQTEPTIWEYYKDESPSTIEFRRLARNIFWQHDSQEVSSLLLTSAAKGEGKTLVAANLAITIAKGEGKRVLLMDCDLRQPTIHSLFGLDSNVGLRALLVGETTLETAIQDTEVENLKIITSGKGNTSPMLLLSSERIKDILDACKAQFDLIICDAPPTVPVHDTEVLAPHVDGVLLVVLAGKTFREVAMRATELLEEAQANVLGVILNDMQDTLPYYYQAKYGYKEST